MGGTGFRSFAVAGSISSVELLGSTIREVVILWRYTLMSIKSVVP